mmetsp:Transcript_751/g.2258  ORF Transcript_751/g.2258 Transcript_751/m.2258 type:complete len:375 (+) Transcript_751:145-1269(+)
MTYSSYSALPTDTPLLTKTEPKFSKSRVAGAAVLAFCLGVAAAAATTSASSLTTNVQVLASTPLAEPPRAPPSAESPSAPGNETSFIPGCGCSLATCCSSNETDVDPRYGPFRHIGCILLINADKDKICAEVAAGTLDGSQSVCQLEEVQQAPPMLAATGEIGKTCADLKPNECSAPISFDDMDDDGGHGGDVKGMSYYWNMGDKIESPDWHDGHGRCYGMTFEWGYPAMQDVNFFLYGPCMTKPVTGGGWDFRGGVWDEGDYLGLLASAQRYQYSDKGCEDLDPAIDEGLVTYFGKDTTVGEPGAMGTCIDWEYPADLSENATMVPMRLIYTYTGLPWACDMKAEDANGAKGSFAASPGYMHNTLLKHPSTQP